MSEFIFQTEFKNVDFKMACSALKQRRIKSGGFMEGWIGFICGALSVGAVAGIIGVVIGGETGIVLVYVIVIAGLVALLNFYGRKGRKAIMETPIRSGVTKVSLTPQGYALEHPGHQGLTRWSHIPGVIVTPQALLILHSDYEYYPIEASAFKDADEMEAVATQIREWIAAAC